jgi:hypothetical protein
VKRYEEKRGGEPKINKRTKKRSLQIPKQSFSFSVWK